MGEVEGRFHERSKERATNKKQDQTPSDCGVIPSEAPALSEAEGRDP